MGRLFLWKGRGEMGERMANVIHAWTALQIGVFAKVERLNRGTIHGNDNFPFGCNH